MKLMFVIAAAALALAGCTLSPKVAGFFGTNDPCAAGSVVHAGFVTAAAVEPKLAKFKKPESALYAGFRGQCSDGDISKITLSKLLDAYVAAVEEWKK